MRQRYVVNRVYNIADEDRLSWKPRFSARQYSDAFVDRIVEKVAGTTLFSKETCRRLHGMNSHKNNRRPKRAFIVL
jgi:hypothetical protein